MKIRFTRRRVGIVMFAMPDIAFLLLIFLILTVSVAEEDEIDVPKFQFVQETDFPDVVTIRVARGGEIEIQGEKYDALTLPDRLTQVPEGNVIHVVADGDAEYLVVDSILDALKSAGLKDVILIAEIDDNL